MANLVVCCDGTWSTPEQRDDDAFAPAPTNVYKLFSAVDLDDPDVFQLTRYQAGVGTGGLIDKALGGFVGYGLSEDIRDCYQWLAGKFEPGDDIYLFGFSRGAYTARSLAGLISRYGIVKLEPGENWEKLIGQIYEGYRKQDAADTLDAAFYPDSNRVRFVGVWDTVGALGIPDDKALLNLFDNPQRYSFHDTRLSSHIETARHAVALDEKRGSFTPTLWDTRDYTGDVKQLWFPGVHSDIGGGYQDMGLSDITLAWMIQEASAAGLRFMQPFVDQIQPNYQGMLHESYVGLMKAMVSVPRTIPDLDAGTDLHPSVVQRRSNPPIAQGPYLPTWDMSADPVSLDIYAKQPWNWTGIYLKAGHRYRFKASGQWMDASIPAGPAGVNDDKFHVGEIAHLTGSVIGLFEKGWKTLFGNEQADFFGTKRIENADWFSLIGAVADGGNPKPDGTHERLSYIKIGDGLKYHCTKSGYLYCFANDARGFYHNNRGFVTLTVEQIS